MFWNNWREKRIIKNAFGEYLSPDIIGEILANSDGKDYLSLKNGTIHFVVFQVRDDNVEIIRSLIEKSINIATQHDVIIGDIISPFVSLFYSIDDVDKKNYQILAKQLINELKTGIKVIYGSKKGAIGNLGTETCMFYRAVIPEMGDYIKKLTSLDYGEIVEV
ncbi:MAG: hypothetical protein IEMM0008_0420 [bacterium]|nr:MAG: hypothetical protein IEMM0008_0420 [bacterium]